MIEVPSIPERHTVHHKQIEDLLTTTLIECAYFSVGKWNLSGSASLKQQKPFLLISVIEGEGRMISGEYVYPFKKGDHMLLPHGLGEFKLEGYAECIVSHL